MRTLVAVDLERVVSFNFLLTPLVGAPTWQGSGGEVGASGGMIAVAMSRVSWRSVVPGMVRRGRGICGRLASVEGTLGRDGLVLRCSCIGLTLCCPWNDPLGSKGHGGCC